MSLNLHKRKERDVWTQREAEIGVMCLSAKEHQEPPEAATGKERRPHEPSEGAQPCST